MSSLVRTRWAAIGAAIAVTIGAGGFGITHAAVNSGERDVFLPITPCRITDTRPATHVGPRTAPLGPSENFTIAARGRQGNCNLPANAAGLSLNITAVNATTQTNLRVYPTDAPLPDTSNLNPSPANSRTVNAATTKLSSTGQFNITNFRGNVDVIIDINGYYVDHNHDDRYYTKTQTDANIHSATAGKADAADVYTKAQTDANLTASVSAAASEAIAGPGVGAALTFSQQASAFQQGVTTTVAGHLSITMSGNFTINCGGNGRYFYILLDGTAVRSSTAYNTGSNPPYAGLLSGVTDDVIPAGSHQIAMGAQCSDTANYSGSGISYFSQSSIVVIP